MNTSTVKQTRIGAYGVVTGEDRILLCRISDQVPEFAGVWTLPGGGLNFGEDPADGMVREVFEETGLTVRPLSVAGVDSISGDLPDRSYHSIRIIYHTEVLGGTLTNEIDGTTDMCKWFSEEEARELNLVGLVRDALPLVFS
jgi:ADP-ribose pyrophosphatase YjhB (NUDIX family)|tara:strand:- start:299 stop:724 length:426 start_codon:yes stop_codon:yes gene_type:complete